jgi:hypothetical protein
VPSPSRSGTGALYRITATSAHSAWAAGVNGCDGCADPKTVILRWNGTTWTRTPSPSGSLYGVTMTSARTAWAVGYTGGFGRTLIMRERHRLEMTAPQADTAGHWRFLSADLPRASMRANHLTDPTASAAPCFLTDGQDRPIAG